MSTQNHVPPTPWYPYAEAAEYLCLSIGTLRNLVSQKRIPFSKRGRIVRFRRDELDAWLTSGTPRRGARLGSKRAPREGKGGVG